MAAIARAAADQVLLSDKFRDALENNTPLDDEMAAHLEWLSNLLRQTNADFGAPRYAKLMARLEQLASR